MKRHPKLFVLSSVVLVLAALGISAFAQTGGVKGKVRTANGKGIPNAVVTVRQDDKDIKTTTSDAKSEFTITGLEKGKYNITFDATGYSFGVLHGVEIRNGIRRLGDRLVLTVDSGTQVLIIGYVFSKEGIHVRAAKVDLEQVNPDGTTKTLASTYSNTFGEFAFARPQGAAKLRVTAKLNGVAASKDIEVEQAAIYRVAVSLNISRDDGLQPRVTPRSQTVRRVPLIPRHSASFSRHLQLLSRRLNSIFQRRDMSDKHLKRVSWRLEMISQLLETISQRRGLFPRHRET